MKTDPTILDTHLDTLRLPFLKEHCQPLAATAAKNSLGHLDYLTQLIEGEAALRADRAVPGASSPPASPSSKPSTPSAGTGPKRSTASKSKTSFASSSFTITPA